MGDAQEKRRKEAVAHAKHCYAAGKHKYDKYCEVMNAQERADVFLNKKTPSKSKSRAPKPPAQPKFFAEDLSVADSWLVVLQFLSFVDLVRVAGVSVFLRGLVKLHIRNVPLIFRRPVDEPGGRAFIVPYPIIEGLYENRVTKARFFGRLECLHALLATGPQTTLCWTPSPWNTIAMTDFGCLLHGVEDLVMTTFPHPSNIIWNVLTRLPKLKSLKICDNVYDMGHLRYHFMANTIRVVANTVCQLRRRVPPVRVTLQLRDAELTAEFEKKLLEIENE